jgi:hypothetical protein
MAGSEEGYVKNKSFNSILSGILTGLMTPLLVMMLYYIIIYRGMRFSSFIHAMDTGGIFGSLLNIGVLVNPLLFFVFLKTDREKTASGVLIATILYVIYLSVTL